MLSLLGEQSGKRVSCRRTDVQNLRETANRLQQEREPERTCSEKQFKFIYSRICHPTITDESTNILLHRPYCLLLLGVPVAQRNHHSSSVCSSRAG